VKDTWETLQYSLYTIWRKFAKCITTASTFVRARSWIWNVKFGKVYYEVNKINKSTQRIEQPLVEFSFVQHSSSLNISDRAVFRCLFFCATKKKTNKMKILIFSEGTCTDCRVTHKNQREGKEIKTNDTGILRGRIFE
jgi:hypothetical protein